MLIDLDHFKQVNDVHGHDAGDLELQSLGKFLAEQVRFGDRVFRFGGEEFLMLLEGRRLRRHGHAPAGRLGRPRQLTTLSAGTLCTASATTRGPRSNEPTRRSTGRSGQGETASSSRPDT